MGYLLFTYIYIYIVYNSLGSCSSPAHPLSNLVFLSLLVIFHKSPKQPVVSYLQGFIQPFARRGPPSSKAVITPANPI